MYFGHSRMCILACIAYYTCSTHIIVVLMASPATGLWSESAHKTDIKPEYQAQINEFHTFI